MTVSFIPNGTRILVEQEEPETVTSAGVVIAAAAAQQKPTGHVVAVGKDAKRFKKGDRVLFLQMTGVEAQLAEGVFLIFDEGDILGTLPK